MSVLSVQRVDVPRNDNSNGTSFQGCRIGFAPVTTEGEYVAWIAPTLRDFHKIPLDGSDEDHVGGEPEDTYVGSFRIVPVQVYGSVNYNLLAELNGDLLTHQHLDGLGIALWEEVERAIRFRECQKPETNRTTS